MRRKKQNKAKGFHYRFGLKSKLLLTVSAILLAAFISSGFFIISISSRTIENDKLTILNQSENVVKSNVEQFFIKYTAQVEQMALDKNMIDYCLNYDENKGVRDSDHFQDVLYTLKETCNADENLTGSFIHVKGTNVLFTNSEWISDDTFKPETRAWYTAVSEKRTIVSEPYEDSTLKKNISTFAAPIYSDGEVVGAVAIYAVVEVLDNIAANQTLGNDGYFILATEEGTVISHKNEEFSFGNIQEIGLSENILQAISIKNSEIMEFNNNGTEMLGRYIPIRGTNWFLISSLPKSEITADINKIILSMALVLVLVYVAVIIAMNVSLVLITKKLKRLTAITNSLADGQLSVDIDINSGDEIGELANSVRSLTERLKTYMEYIDESEYVLNNFSNGNLIMDLKQEYTGEFERLKRAIERLYSMLSSTILQIGDSSETINKNAEHLASVSQELAQGTTEQASAIEELSAEMNQIYSNILSNAENSKRAGQRALETSEEVNNGNSKMKEMLASIDEIGNASSEIEKIIKVIDDIAFQTNILALNAAVEAARAGSAGKGFAVVADEVRNLAGKSAEAAKQTTNLIGNSILAIKRGTALADETGKSLMEIVDKTKSTSGLIAEIGDAMEQQITSINHIKTGIEQISSVVQQNAGSAEASASNSEELSSQSSILKELVNKFKVNKKDSETAQ